MTGTDGPIDFFITYAGPDEGWAKWVDQQLRDADYTTEVDVWDWSAGTNVVSALGRALGRARRMVALLSPHYFGLPENEAALSAALWEHARVDAGYLVPVLVAPCDDHLPLNLRTLRSIDIVGLGEAEARAVLMAGLLPRARPPSGYPTPFPGAESVFFPADLPSVWNLPTPNAFFTGRETLLGRMHLLLTADGSRRGSPLLSLHGTGGVGKSQLALTYAWRHHRECRSGWWIDAESPDSMGLALDELAASLGLRSTGGATALGDRLRAALSDRGPWLLVYDNVTDPGSLPVLGEGGRVIVTCRDAPAAGMASLRVDGFGRDESVRLLRRRVPRLTAPEADRVAGATGDLPLAVAQAAAYLARADEPVADYLARLRAALPPASSGVPGLPGGTRRSSTASAGPAGDPRRERPAEGDELAATVATAVGVLAASDPDALRLLQQFALLAPEPVPLAASSRLRPGSSARGLIIGEPNTAARLVGAMTALDLVRLDGSRLVMHRRVQASVRALMPLTSLTAMLGRALDLLATGRPGDPRVPETWSDYANLVPHVQAVTRLLETVDVAEPAAFRRLLRDLTASLTRAGRPGTARALDELTLTRRRRTLGDDHPDTLATAADLARDLHGLGGGQHEVARALDEETLLRRRIVLGEDHPDTLSSVNNLANGQYILADYAGARRRHEDAVAGRRRVLGADHPDTLTSASNLASDLFALGDHGGARTLHEDTLSRRRRVLGHDHPDTLASAHNLALALRALGARAEARALDEETLGRRRRVLGENHPDALASAHSLAADLRALGEHAEARRLDEDTLDRRRRVLGADHRDTLVSASSLALDLRRLGDHRAALALDEDTLDRRRRVLGLDAPDTLVCAIRVAAGLRAVGRPDKARALDEDTLARCRSVLGVDHPHTRRLAENLRRPAG